MNTQLQFFALSIEIMEWAEEWRGAFRLQELQLQHFPAFRTALLLGDVVRPNWAPARIYLTPGVVPVRGDTANVVERNLGTDVAAIDLGPEDATALVMSCLRTSATTPSAGAIWRLITKAVKERTHAGVWALGGTGVRRFYKNVRYSAGAAALATRGVTLRALAGTVTYQIPSEGRGTP